jgi:hypothetical protein
MTPYLRQHAGALAASALAGMALVVCGGCVGSRASPGESAAQAATTSPPRDYGDCMFAVVVTDWAALDDQRFIIFGHTRKEAYLGRAFFPTPDLTLNVGMAVIDDDHNGQICGRSTDSIAFRNQTIPGKNLIASLQKITKEEAEALIANAKKPNAKQQGSVKPEQQKQQEQPRQ